MIGHEIMELIMSNFNFDKLKTTEHMLKWLADKPYLFILKTVTDMLNHRIAGTIVQSFLVTSEPEWITGLLACQEDDQHKIVTRAGCAFECAMYVQTTKKLHYLTGVYSCVILYLDKPKLAREKTWLDLDTDLSLIGAQGELKKRLYFDQLTIAP